MNTTSPDLPALGTRRCGLWASGDRPAVAADLVPGLGASVVEAAGITAGQRARAGRHDNPGLLGR